MEAAMDLRRACARYAIDNVDWAKCVRQLNKDLQVANSFLSDELKVRQICLHADLLGSIASQMDALSALSFRYC
jgi:hypothetical protein